MTMWLFSDVVMMYDGSLKLTAMEGLTPLPHFDSQTCCISLSETIKMPKSNHLLQQA